MMLPDFLCIGAQRAGTTWVHQCLLEHPEVFVPRIKETQFFDQNFTRGRSWYESFFADADGDATVGEVSPNYLNVDGVASRVRDLVPDVKIFVIYRDPVDRAYSAYKLLVEDRYRGQSFREALANGDYLVRLGMYAQMMEPYFALFAPSQIQSFTYDQLVADPAGFLRELFEYLGVDSSFEPPSTLRPLNRVMYRTLQTRLDSVGLGGAARIVKRTPLGDWLRIRHGKRGVGGGEGDGATALDSADVAYLKQIFCDDIDALEELTNLDLSSWR